jgi:hypothetical protein
MVKGLFSCNQNGHFGGPNGHYLPMAISKDWTLFSCQFSVDKNGRVSKWLLSPELPHKFLNDIIFLVNFIIPQKSTANHFFVSVSTVSLFGSLILA